MQFNVEEISRITSSIQTLEEVIPTGKKGIENSVALAEESGSEKFKKSANNLAEASEIFFQSIREFIEVSTELENTYKRLDQGLN